MQLLILLEHRFRRTPDGVVWSDVGYGPGFWQKYRDIFDRVRVLARVQGVPAAPPNDWCPASCEGVEFSPVPYYIGPAAYLGQMPEIGKAIDQAYNNGVAVIMRVPSFLSRHLWARLRADRHPYGLEVVGDPLDALAPGVIRHPLRPFLHWWMPQQQRKQCAQAAAVRYVTEHALQRRYPCPKYMTGVSDVDLPASAFRGRREPRECRRRLVTIAAMEQPYKGIQHLLGAVARCVSNGLDIHLTIVGGGALRPEYEWQTEGLGLQMRVEFRGPLPAGDAVRAVLDDADLFVLPSLTEGLPRAMLEAMARSMPCIGTAVGGIPELLVADNLVAPGDVAGLAAKIAEVLGNPSRMARMSEENLVRASQFAEFGLRDRRNAFYRHLRTVTQEWIDANSRNRSTVALYGGA
jgi:glycosyltransferase involved in cell wall biosynthesis